METVRINVPIPQKQLSILLEYSQKIQIKLFEYVQSIFNQSKKQFDYDQAVQFILRIDPVKLSDFMFQIDSNQNQINIQYSFYDFLRTQSPSKVQKNKLQSEKKEFQQKIFVLLEEYAFTFMKNICNSIQQNDQQVNISLKESNYDIIYYQRIIQNLMLKIALENYGEEQSIREFIQDLKGKNLSLQSNNQSINDNLNKLSKNQKSIENLEEGNYLIKNQLQDKQKLIESMRKSFLKDITQLRNQMALNDKYQNQDGEERVFFDVQYFDGTIGLSEEIIQILNNKIQHMHYQYNLSLRQLEQLNHKLLDQIQLYQKLEKHGNVGIRFSEMNCESVIEKLSFIVSDPDIVWNSIETYFSKGFFYDSIERQFGITPNTHNNLVAKFDEKLNQYQESALKKIDDLKTQSQFEISRLKQLLADTQKQTQDIKNQQQSELLEQKKQLKDAFDFKLNIETASLKKLFDAEKQEFIDEMIQLKSKNLKQQIDKDQYDKSLFFEKWLFFSKIQKLNQKNSKQTVSKNIAEEVGKQFFNREIKKLRDLNGRIIEDLQEELRFQRQENLQLCKKISEIEYDIFLIKKERNKKQEKEYQSQLELENLQNKLIQANKERNYYYLEHLNQKKNNDQSKSYINQLELQVSSMKIKIEKLNQIAKKYNQKQEKLESTILYATKGQDKALFFINNEIEKTNEEIQGKNQIDQSQLTNLFGIDNELTLIKKQDKEIFSQNPSQFVQTQQDFADKEIQVELLYDDQQKLNINNQEQIIQFKSEFNSKKKFDDISEQQSNSKDSKQKKRNDHKNYNLQNMESQSFQNETEYENKIKNIYKKNLSLSEISSFSKSSEDLSESIKGNKYISEFQLNHKRNYNMNQYLTQFKQDDKINIKIKKQIQKAKLNKKIKHILEFDKIQKEKIDNEQNQKNQSIQKMNIFSQTHLEFILQKNLRLNIRKIDKSCQTIKKEFVDYQQYKPITGNFDKLECYVHAYSKENSKSQRSIVRWISQKLQSKFNQRNPAKNQESKPILSVQTQKTKQINDKNDNVIYLNNQLSLKSSQGNEIPEKTVLGSSSSSLQKDQQRLLQTPQNIVRNQSAMISKSRQMYSKFQAQSHFSLHQKNLKHLAYLNQQKQALNINSQKFMENNQNISQKQTREKVIIFTKSTSPSNYQTIPKINLDESIKNNQKIKKQNKNTEQFKIRNLSGRTEQVNNKRKLIGLANTIQPGLATSKIQNEIQNCSFLREENQTVHLNNEKFNNTIQQSISTLNFDKNIENSNKKANEFLSNPIIGFDQMEQKNSINQNGQIFKMKNLSSHRQFDSKNIGFFNKDLKIPIKISNQSKKQQESNQSEKTNTLKAYATQTYKDSTKDNQNYQKHFQQFYDHKNLNQNRLINYQRTAKLSSNKNKDIKKYKIQEGIQNILQINGDACNIEKSSKKQKIGQKNQENEQQLDVPQKINKSSQIPANFNFRNLKNGEFQTVVNSIDASNNRSMEGDVQQIQQSVILDQGQLKNDIFEPVYIQ